MTLVEEKHDILQAEKSLEPKAAIAVKNVLFATDFSETAESALPYAAAICRRFGSTLHAVHVVSEASTLLMTGGVDYVSVSTIYEDA
jgi:nucleotide-binding universal stress UspA family protein